MAQEFYISQENTLYFGLNTQKLEKENKKKKKPYKGLCNR